MTCEGYTVGKGVREWRIKIRDLLQKKSVNALQKAWILKGAKTPTAHTNFSNSTSDKLAKLAASPWQEVFI